MTLTKAIEIINGNLIARPDKMPVQVRDALNLSIAALRAVKDGRTDNYCAPIPLLPGETQS